MGSCIRVNSDRRSEPVRRASPSLNAVSAGQVTIKTMPMVVNPRRPLAREPDESVGDDDEAVVLERPDGLSVDFLERLRPLRHEAQHGRASLAERAREGGLPAGRLVADPS